jgi:hypothetical protein
MMPTIRPPTEIGRSHFPTRRGSKRGVAKIPPRAAELIRLMTMGPGEGVAPLSFEDAYKHMGIKRDTAMQYWRHPLARAEFLSIEDDLRRAERSRNRFTMVEIRDDPLLAESAAGAKARLESIRLLEGDPEDTRRGHQPPSVHVNPGIVVQVNVNRAMEVDDTLIEVNPVPQTGAFSNHDDRA